MPVWMDVQFRFCAAAMLGTARTSKRTAVLMELIMISLLSSLRAAYKHVRGTVPALCGPRSGFGLRSRCARVGSFRSRGSWWLSLTETRICQTSGYDNGTYVLSLPAPSGSNWTSPIVRLLFSSGPFAVIRLIIAIIVDSFDGEFRRRPSTHIFDKLGEIQPSFTNGNPPRPITIEGNILRIIAARFHFQPYRVLGPFSFSPTCSSVLQTEHVPNESVQMAKACFLAQAATAFCIASFKGLRIYNACIAAVTVAIPSGIFVRRICARA